MIIRKEEEADFQTIYSLVKSAFATAEHSDGQEQNLVDALRMGAAYVPELSLVAEMEGHLVGHIMFTEAQVGERVVLVLAPLSVWPRCQKMGVGSALIQEGHRLAVSLGYEYSLVLGSAEYYPRFGYSPALDLGIEAPFEVPSENFMVLQLVASALPVQGVVCYAKEFGVG